MVVQIHEASPADARRARIMRPALLAAALAIASLYVYFLACSAVNVPYGDDYQDVLGFLVAYRDTTSPVDRIGEMIAQHTDHRNGFSRLIYALYFEFTGKIDFGHLAWIGNLSALVFIGGYLAAMRKDFAALGVGAPVLLVLIVASLLNLSYYDSMVWPMVAISNFWVNAFALLAMLGLGAGSRAGFLFAVASAIAGTYTFASGQLIWPVGLLMLLAREKHSRLPRACAWIAFAAVTLLLFRAGYTSNLDATLAMDLLCDVPKLLAHFLPLVGSAFAFGNRDVATVLGTVLLTAFVASALLGAWKRAPAMFFTATFLLGALGVVAVTRHPWGVELLVNSSRYRFVAGNACVSILALLVIALGARSPLAARRLAYGVTALTVAAALATYPVYAPKLGNITASRLNGIAAWVETGSPAGLDLPLVRPPVLLQDLRTLTDAGVYDPPVAQ